LNPRTPIEMLKLTGSTNLRRALKREEAEENLRAPKNAAEEVARLDELIALAMKACRRGQTVNDKRNPAFGNLASLVRIRKMILERGGVATKKSGEEILAEADRLMGVN
jgi:hypothetical protein